MKPSSEEKVGKRTASGSEVGRRSGSGEEARRSQVVGQRWGVGGAEEFVQE